MASNVVVLSGGLDSTVTLAVACKALGRTRVEALAFDYGQMHARELAAATNVAVHYNVPLRTVGLDHAFTPSALTGAGTIPDGAYTADTLAATEVVGRNLAFAALAVARAGSGGTVWVGVHGGDHDQYPDTRPEFWRHVKAAAAAYDVAVQVPFLLHTKATIVQRGHLLDAPMHLTWSCYRGGEQQCGTCSTCTERREAFTLAQVPDPTVYATAAE